MSGARSYTVCYPSGKVFTARGDTLKVAPTPIVVTSPPASRLG